MKKVNKTVAPVTYKGAGHGFMRAGDAPEPEAPATTGNAETDKAATEKYQQR